MDLQPLGDRLIVEVLEDEETTISGIVLPDTAKEKPQRGRVLAAGPGSRNDKGELIAMEVAVGDEIIFSKYGGTEIKLGADEIQLDLFGDYKSNVALYPTFQKYFRTHKPRFLAVWGKNDPFFLPRGAEAFKRDIPGVTVRFFDTGHFALETHAAEIAATIRDFLAP